MRSVVRTVRMPEGHLKGLSRVRIVFMKRAASDTRLHIIITFFS